MIPGRLKIVLLTAIILFFVITLSLLKHKRLALKYTLLWLFTGAFMLLFVALPELMVRLTRLAGIQSSMNGLFILLIGFLIMLAMSLTSIVSRQSERIKELAQTQALLEKRVRELEASGEDASGGVESCGKNGEAGE